MPETLASGSERPKSGACGRRTPKCSALLRLWPLAWRWRIVGRSVRRAGRLLECGDFGRRFRSADRLGATMAVVDSERRLRACRRRWRRVASVRKAAPAGAALQRASRRSDSGRSLGVGGSCAAADGGRYGFLECGAFGRRFRIADRFGPTTAAVGSTRRSRACRRRWRRLDGVRKAAPAGAALQRAAFSNRLARAGSRDARAGNRYHSAGS